MDQVTFAVMTSLVLLGKFADFLLESPVAAGAEPEGAPPARLEGSFLHGALRGARDYLVSVFRVGFWNRTRLWRILMISAFLVQGSFLFSSLVAPGMWSGGEGAFPLWWISGAVIALILVNFVFDLIAISLVISLLDRTLALADDFSLKRIAGFVAVIFVVGVIFYAIVISAMNLSFSLILHLQGVVAGYEALFEYHEVVAMQWRVMATETEWRYLDPVGEGAFIGINGVNLLIFCLTPLLAPGLLALVAVAGALMDIADAATSGQVRKIFSEFAQERKPFFLKLASILALAGAAASTLMDG